jgi:hypothetical protein
VSRPDHGHNSPDAYLFMRYEGPGGRREWIWNSRDGITPFCVGSADGQVTLQHANWHLDQYRPSFVPPVGSRIFVDITEELARPLAEAYVAKGWEDAQYPMRDAGLWPDRAAAVEHFVKSWVSDWGGHSPHVVVVTPALHAQFKARADAVLAGHAKP